MLYLFFSNFLNQNIKKVIEGIFAITQRIVSFFILFYTTYLEVIFFDFARKVFFVCNYINTLYVKSIYGEGKILFFKGVAKISVWIVILFWGITFESRSQTYYYYKDLNKNGRIDINYIEQLDSMRYNLTGTLCERNACYGYELMRSLDFNDPDSYRSGVVNTSFTTGEGWNPIGTFGGVNDFNSHFNTIFEGNGYTIDNLYINRRTDHTGLFGSIRANNRIQNIGLRNVSVSGSRYVGGLVGWSEGTIDHSYVTGFVTGSTNIGGLAGWNQGLIIQSHAVGSVSSYASYYIDAVATGGLVGFNYHGTISQSYAKSTVSGNISYGQSGGLVGITDGGRITQSYATGSVSGSNYVGGLLGLNINGGTISQSYATGSVSGNNYFGGLLGYYTGTIQHGYWNNSNRKGIGNNSTGYYVREFSLSDFQNSSGTATNTIRELGPGFLYYMGKLPKLHTGARLTVNGVNFTQLIPRNTNIESNSTVANVMQGTDTTRATITVNGINFTANVIDTTSGRLRPPYIITSIQNGLLPLQNITFAPLSMKTYGDAPFTLTATSSFGLPILYSTSSTLVNINNDMVNINGAGTVLITAYNSENDTIDFVFATQILSIQKINDSINFEVLRGKYYGDAPFVLTAESSTGLSVLFSASSSVVSISNNTVTINRVGTVGITAYSENDTLFGFVNQILTINKGMQTISFEALANRSYGDALFVLTAVSSVGLPVAFSSSSTLLSIRNDTVIINGGGIVNITAYQLGNKNYLNANPVVQILTIFRTILTFQTIPNLNMGQTHTLSATSNSPVPIIFTSSDTKIATVNENILIAVGTGTAFITASQKENTGFNSFTAQQPVTVVNVPYIHPLTFIEKENPAIHIYPNPAKDYLTIKSAVQIEKYSLYRLDGTLVLGDKGVQINIQSLNKGEYIIIVYGEKGEVLKAEKVIKE